MTQGRPGSFQLFYKQEAGDLERPLYLGRPCRFLFCFNCPFSTQGRRREEKEEGRAQVCLSFTHSAQGLCHSERTLCVYVIQYWCPQGLLSLLNPTLGWTHEGGCLGTRVLTGFLWVMLVPIRWGGGQGWGTLAPCGRGHRPRARHLRKCAPGGP